MLDGAELNIDVSGLNGTALAMSFSYVFVLGLEDHLTRRIVDDGYVYLFGISEHTCPHVSERVYRLGLIRERNMISVRSDDGIVGVLVKVIRAEITEKIVFGSADGPCGEGVGEILIKHIDAVIELILIGFEVIEVEYRSYGPISEEREIGNREVDTRCIIKSYKSLDVHSVFKGISEILLIRLGKGDGNLDRGAGACIDRDPA